MGSLIGFPGIDQLNETRWQLFNEAHNWNSRSEQPTHIKCASWLAHKAVTVISLPANVVGVGLGAIGVGASICTLGALKVAIFALTAGYIKPEFPSGFLWSLERTAHSVAAIFCNVVEVCYDAANVIYEVVYNTLYHASRCLRWIVETLHLDDLLMQLLIKIGDIIRPILEKLTELFVKIIDNVITPALEFCARRLSLGFQKAVESENSSFNYSRIILPFPMQNINDAAEASRINWGSSDDRSFGTIGKHYVCSLAAIPMNALLAVNASIHTLAMAIIFCAKVIVYATTNINIAIRTGILLYSRMTSNAISNIISEVVTDVADVFVLTYKISSALRLGRAFETAGKIIKYIPEAVFS